MTTRIETRLQRLEATLASREAHESDRTVLQRLDAIEATRELTPDELHQQLGAVVRLCGGAIADVFTVVAANGPAQAVEEASD